MNSFMIQPMMFPNKNNDRKRKHNEIEQQETVISNEANEKRKAYSGDSRKATV